MKKITLLLILFVVVTARAQRISSLTIEGKPSCVPFAAFNPKNNSDTETGEGQMVFPVGTDLSNVSVTIMPSENASVVEPVTLPADWSSTVTGIKVQNSETAPKDPNAWAKYTITLKVIKPAALPLEIKTGKNNFDSNSWTTETQGWAATCIDKDKDLIRFGNGKRSFVVAFTDVPDSLFYTIKASSEWKTENKVFDVDGSVDGVTWTSIKQYNTETEMPSSALSEKLEIKNANYRYIRWIYTKRATKTNVFLENILVTKKSGSSGLRNNQIDRIQLYFDANRVLYLENAEAVESLRLYNIMGAIVLEKSNPASAISTTDFTPGIYVAEVKLKDGKIGSKKIVL